MSSIHIDIYPLTAQKVENVIALSRLAEQMKKMKSDSVSIIIPIYNEEERLHRCVQSVISQTYRDLEIILVDDGSTDGSADICDRFAMQDSRIRVIHQDNQGLSAARNAGLDIATSGYIQFVDSDDWILPTMTEELLEALEEDSSDAVQCGFYMLSEPSKDDNPYVDINTDADHLKKRKIYSGDDLFFQMTRAHMITVVQWNKLFKKEIFEDLRFPIGKLHEDEFLIHRELARMKTMSYLDRKLYVYTQNPNSITHQRSLKNSMHICEAYLDRTKFLLDNDVYSAGKTAYVMFLRQLALCESLIKVQDESKMTMKDINNWLCQIRGEIRTIPLEKVQ